jgi:cytochrome c oxidase assembly factor CtaG
MWEHFRRVVRHPTSHAIINIKFRVSAFLSLWQRQKEVINAEFGVPNFRPIANLFKLS